MEEKIEDSLKEIYKNSKIEVKFIEFRKYEIYFEISLFDNFTKHIEAFSFQYLWNNNFTYEFCIKDIEDKIDKYLIKLFKEEYNK